MEASLEAKRPEEAVLGWGWGQLHGRGHRGGGEGDRLFASSGQGWELSEEGHMVRTGFEGQASGQGLS